LLVFIAGIYCWYLLLVFIAGIYGWYLWLVLLLVFMAGIIAGIRTNLDTASHEEKHGQNPRAPSSRSDTRLT